MFSLVIAIAIAAASQAPAPQATVQKASHNVVDKCAEYGDYAFVIMEDVRKGRAAGTMLQEAQKTGGDDQTREALFDLVVKAFDAHRITEGGVTPKRFSDELTLSCYQTFAGK